VGGGGGTETKKRKEMGIEEKTQPRNQGKYRDARDPPQVVGNFPGRICCREGGDYAMALGQTSQSHKGTSGGTRRDKSPHRGGKKRKGVSRPGVGGGNHTSNRRFRGKHKPGLT